MTLGSSRRRRKTIIQTASKAVYYKRNIEVRSRNHRCRGKAIGITHSECVPVTLAHAPYYCVICGLSGFNIFFHIISQKARFPKEKKKLLNIKRVMISSITFAGNISRTKTIQRDNTINAKQSRNVPVMLVRF